MAAWTEAYANSATIGTAQYSLTNNSTTIASQTTKGTYQIVLDLAAVATADQFEIRVLEKARTSGTQRRAMSAIITGGMTDLWFSPALMLGNGWDVTVQRLDGTDRAIEWSIRAYT
jgi:hypothetical protein